MPADRSFPSTPAVVLTKVVHGAVYVAIGVVAVPLTLLGFGGWTPSPPPPRRRYFGVVYSLRDMRALRRRYGRRRGDLFFRVGASGVLVDRSNNVYPGATLVGTARRSRWTVALVDLDDGSRVRLLFTTRFAEPRHD